jgi:hypothetical protein
MRRTIPSLEDLETLIAADIDLDHAKVADIIRPHDPALADTLLARAPKPTVEEASRRPRRPQEGADPPWTTGPQKRTPPQATGC